MAPLDVDGDVDRPVGGRAAGDRLLLWSERSKSVTFRTGDIPVTVLRGVQQGSVRSQSAASLDVDKDVDIPCGSRQSLIERNYAARSDSVSDGSSCVAASSRPRLIPRRCGAVTGGRGSRGSQCTSLVAVVSSTAGAGSWMSVASCQHDSSNRCQ